MWRRLLNLCFVGDLILEASTTLSVTVQQEGNADPLPCRAWVEASGKRLFQPATGPSAPYERDRSFSCDGRFSVEVPPGKVVVHVERGKEYVPTEEAVTVIDRRTTEVTITLHRWIDMLKQGWYSADMHIHMIDEDRRVMKAAKLADDLRILGQMALRRRRQHGSRVQLLEQQPREVA